MAKVDEVPAGSHDEIVDTVGGCKLYRREEDGRVHMIEANNGREIRLGQRVYANGRYWAEDGTPGIVTNLAIPFSGGRTTNIIDVWFVGHMCETRMKVKDLRLE